MKNKNGFSLVELIVVAAIMAVLIGILAPSYLSYVEKTREELDKHDAEEIRKATETIILSGSYTVEETVVVTYSCNGIQVTEADYATALEDELRQIFPDFPNEVPKSKKYTDAVYSVSLTEDVNATLNVSGSWDVD